MIHIESEVRHLENIYTDLWMNHPCIPPLNNNRNNVGERNLRDNTELSSAVPTAPSGVLSTGQYCILAIHEHHPSLVGNQ